MNLRVVAVSSSLGALRLVFSLIGAGIPGLLGIPGASGAINILWAGGFLALPPLITKRFGSGLVAGTVYGLLALPLPLSGPPGFLPKVLIGMTTGLAADLIFLLPIKNTLVSALLMAATAQTLLGIEFGVLGLAFQVPGIDQYVEFQFSPVGLIGTFLGGALSGFLAWLVFIRIEESPVVTRIQEGSSIQEDSKR